MSTQATPVRELKPGSSGWTTDDLDRPEYQTQWETQHVELVHGVIAEMPPALFDHGRPSAVLCRLLDNYFEDRGIEAYSATNEIDVQVSDTTRYRADVVVMTAGDLATQRERQAQRKPGDPRIGVLLVPPTLVIESVSEGHEAHDYRVKRDDYARFGVPNYWIVDYTQRSLTCLRLQDKDYVEDAVGRVHEEVEPSVYPGLVIPLRKVFM